MSIRKPKFLENSATILFSLPMALIICLGLGACSNDDEAPLTTTALTIVANSLPTSAAAGIPLANSLLLTAQGEGGVPISGAVLEVAIVRGGGTITPAQATTDINGQASFSWTLGRAPVLNQVRAATDMVSVSFDVTGILDEPWTPESFVDVNAHLTEQGREGSTEDLAFDSEGRLILGVPEGLVSIDQNNTISDLVLSGDSIALPLGIAYDRAGNLWLADVQGNALRKVSPEGIVNTVLSEVKDRALQPNYVAVGPQGNIYVSDHCFGELLQIDPQSGEVLHTLSFDLTTTGGPNGFAFDAVGQYLYISTENTVLLCNDFTLDLEVDAEVAGLFRVAVTESGFGEMETVVAEVGLFGDGMAFDEEGNLYAIFDRQENLALSESTVFVLPEGETELVPFISVSDYVMANIAFGQGNFDHGDLYIATLAVPGFTLPETRGVRRFNVGIAGQPLLP